MAERRMFAKTIIDSDAFMEMPLSAQALYFHLGMRADDEGFINNPKNIQRMVGASGEDLKMLIDKHFVIEFKSGVIVIKHWKINNYIRSDRLVETKYTEEKGQLILKENGAYSKANYRREDAYKQGSLPYGFSYKIRHAFVGKTCPVCGVIMDYQYKTLSSPTIQHNIPISKGGAHEINNISVICRSCNSSLKDTETPPYNNAEVVDTWERILYAEKNEIDWFDDPEILKTVYGQTSDGQVTDKRRASDSIDKNSIDKNSIVYASLEESAPEISEEDIQRITDAWNNQECVSKIAFKITPLSAWYDRIRLILKDESLEDFIKTIESLNEQEWLIQRKNERMIFVDFRKFTDPEFYSNVKAGKYRRVFGSEKKTTRNVFKNFDERDQDWDKLENRLFGQEGSE